MLISFAVSCAVAVILTPVFGALSRRAGWLDWPDGQRKRQLSPVPPCGGCVLAVAALGALLFESRPPSLLLLSIAIIFVTGLLDDLRGLPVWARIVLQIAAAALAVTSGIRLEAGAGGTLLTVAWLILCTNAINLIDGMDGLAAMVGLLGAAAMLFMGHAPSALLYPWSGALAGFLWFNLPPARVYLGDSGSLTTGFILGCAAAQTTTGVPRALLAPALALSLPLLDTAWAVARRFRDGKPLFAADRGHIHHLVLDRTGSARSALVLLTVASLAVSTAAVAVHALLFRGRP
jgi:UDP-GlcNAc:undecaprenyl-phosphate GlcNAc-1-phosphate transferase